jgi:phage terminase large subunit-like protein
VAAAKAWPPALLSPVRPRAKSDGKQCADFIEAFCRITKDSIAGRSGTEIKLRPWQKSLLHGLLERRPDGRRKHRQSLIGMPRKNGKSALGSGIALWGLFCGPDGGEVYSCAGEREQARIVFGAAKRMIEMDPELSGLAKLYRDAVEIPSTGSIYRVLSAEAYSKEGLNPSLVLFDEVHVQPNDELWNVMSLASGARVDPLMVGITTAGSRTDTRGGDTLCYRLYQHGRQVAANEVDDPSFFFAWWEPRKGTECDHADPSVWKESNPGYGDLVDPEDFESSVKRTPEAEFRTKRTNVWVVSSSSALPHGAWDANENGASHDADLVLFCDGSWSGDSTGIVSATVEPRPHLDVVDLWERPADGEGWRVPIEDVEQTIIDTCRAYPVRAVVFDPFRWQRTMQVLENQGIPILEFPTNSPARMVPAWKAFYDAVLDGGLSHSGDPRLARHIENMRLKIDQQGARPVKETASSQRHIDLGICAIGAFFEALTQLAVPDDAEPFAFYV